MALTLFVGVESVFGELGLDLGDTLTDATPS
jgi:hypothetical protein